MAVEEKFTEDAEPEASLFGIDERDYQVLLDKFAVRRTVRTIKASQFSRIALQFPDSFLAEAPVVCVVLSISLGSEYVVFILGDTSYGACCPDEVTAEHLNADAIVHYGQACLTPTRSLPVLYVFPGTPSLKLQEVQNVKGAIESIVRDNPDASRVVVMFDTCLTEAMFLMEEELLCIRDINVELAVPRCTSLQDFVLPELESSQENDEQDLIVFGALAFSKSANLTETVVLWISQSNDCDAQLSPALYNLSLVLSNGMKDSCRGLYNLSLEQNVMTQVNGWRSFRRRVGEVERVRHAERIGVVAGTLAAAHFNETIERLVGAIEGMGKRAYVMLVGKLNASKLLNFEEMDAFVLVSCPERALQFNGGELNVPFLTPFELFSALSENDSMFETRYELDLAAIAKAKRERKVDEDVGNVVAKRDNWDVSVSGAGSASTFFKGRSWKGLHPTQDGSKIQIDRLDTKVRQGQFGTAQQYQKR